MSPRKPFPSSPLIPRVDPDSDPPLAGEPSLSAVHLDVEKIKFRQKQMEHEIATLEAAIARLDGEHTDSKVKAVRVEDFISREQASRNEWRATMRGIFGAVLGAIVLAALGAVGKLLWEVLKQ